MSSGFSNNVHLKRSNGQWLFASELRPGAEWEESIEMQWMDWVSKGEDILIFKREDKIIKVTSKEFNM